MELQDLIFEYPDQDDPDIQEKLYALKEFNSLKTEVNESVKPGDYYNHQKIIQRLMRIYDHLIIIHDTGTGKSYTIGAIGKLFQRLYLETGKGIKKVLVLVKNDTQLNNINKLLIESTGIERKKTKKKIAEFFQIETHDAFSTNLATLDDEKIIENYSDYCIIIDEVHNFHLDDKNENDKDGSDKAMNIKYHAIKKLTHLPKRSKFIGLTATPIRDKVNDCISTLNLFLPENNQIDGKTDMENIALEELEEKLRGRISYVRLNLDPRIIIEPQGETFEIESSGRKSEIIIKTLEMSKLQQKVYDSYLKGLETKRQDLKKKGEGAFGSAQRQISNMVYPDKEYGSEGIKLYSESEKKANKLEPYYKSVQKFGELSPKYAKIFEIITEIRSPADVTKRAVVAINFEFVEGGIEAFKNMLERIEFADVTDPESMVNYSLFESKITKKEIAERTGGLSDLYGKPPSSPRFAIIRAGRDNSDILDIVTSPENVYGDYIQVVIFSDSGKEGISINNALVYIQVGPHFSTSSNYQAKSRIYRAGSHNDILKKMEEKEREKAAAKGRKPEKVRLKIKEYYLAAMHPDTNIESQDFRGYELSEQKKITNSLLMRKLKKIAIDCPLHLKRNLNLEAGFIDGSKDCDYQECKYSCFLTPKEPETFPDENYNLRLGGDTSLEIARKVNEYFARNSSGSVSMVTSYIFDSKKKAAGLGAKKSGINKERENEVQMYLNEMIINYVKIIDRFGFETYLREDRGLYFLTRDRPISIDQEDDACYGYYQRNPFFSKTNDIVSLNLEVSQSMLPELIAKIESLDPKGPKENQTVSEIKALIEDMGATDRINIFEHYYKTQSPMRDYILEANKNLYLEIEEPLEELEASEKVLKSMSGKNTSAKKKIIQEYLDIKPAEVIKKKDKRKIVVFHTINVFNSSNAPTLGAALRNVYSMGPETKNICKIMVKNKDEDEFKEAEEVEELAYAKIMLHRRLNIVEEFRKKDSYRGYYLLKIGGIVKLVDDTQPEEIQENGQKKNKGKDIKTWSLEGFSKVIADLKISSKIVLQTIEKLNDPIITEITKSIRNGLKEIGTKEIIKSREYLVGELKRYKELKKPLLDLIYEHLRELDFIIEY